MHRTTPYKCRFINDCKNILIFMSWILLVVPAYAAENAPGTPQRSPRVKTKAARNSQISKPESFLSPKASAVSTTLKEEVKTSYLCPDLLVKGEISPSFTDMEKRLTCGEGKDNDSTDSAWESIPFNQAKYSMTNFLQDRGYHHPVYGHEGKLKWVIVGHRTRIKSLTLDGVADVIDLKRKRKVIGEVLTPSILHAMENWVSERLQAVGYGCPVVTSLANADTGEVVIRVDPGVPQNLIAVTEDPIPNLMPGTFSRYYALHLDEPFNGDFVSVTQSRISSQSLVDSNHFAFKCDKLGVTAHHIIVPGAPRLITFGAGIDTEGVVRLRVSWRNVRVGDTGSLVDLTALGSFRKQTLTPSVNWYFLPYPSRKYLLTSIELMHDYEPQFHVITLTGEAGYATSYDTNVIGGDFFIGPKVNLTRDISQPSAPYTAQFLFLEARFSLRSHEFEYFASNPNSGYNLTFITDLSHPALFSVAPAQRFNFNGEYLWNLKNYDPPLVVFAVRGGFGALVASDKAIASSQIPRSFYQYLGGSTDLRGFSLKALPRYHDLTGARTSVFAGFEARLANTLPYNIDPFAFFDIGALGMAAFQFDSPIYTSPGLGIRWKSPIGVLRVTLAYGFAGTPDDHFQPFFSFGEEF
jgi:translocation and assembly module TamA